MRLSTEEVRHIALLARVGMTDDEVELMRDQLKEMGATVLRGGAFKPRTSPYSFQGLGLEGLKFLAKAREQTGLAIVAEALDPEGADLVAEYADIVDGAARRIVEGSASDPEAGVAVKALPLATGQDRDGTGEIPFSEATDPVAEDAAS